MRSVGYIVLEYLLCIVAVVGLGIFVFASSLLVVLARDGFARVLRAARRARRPIPQTSQSSVAAI